MEASSASAPLVGAEIHGFRTAGDLDIDKLKATACTRWLRPNEVHAVLSNYTRFKVHPQTVDKPPSGTIVLFDRKVVRNFRKDGHNWKKKKDGKSVQEAHEKLKVGNEERVHVYYAKGEEDPNFYRRCYWLLDKEFERIVLVHYRSTSEDINAHAAAEIEFSQIISVPNIKYNLNPLTHNSEVSNSNSISQYSEVSAGLLSEEINSQAINGKGKNEFTLDEINTLEWDDLIEPPIQQDNYAPAQQGVFGSLSYEQISQMNPQNITNEPSQVNNSNFAGAAQVNSSDYFPYEDSNKKLSFNELNSISNAISNNKGFVSQVGFENWNENSTLDNSQKICFNITDISPNWAYSTDQTKVLLVGYFLEEYKQLYLSNLFCNIGGKIVNTEKIQPGVYRIITPPNTPGNTDLYLTLDGPTPISQILPFNYIQNPNSLNTNPNSQDFLLQARLAQLLFNNSNKITTLSNQKPQKFLKEMIKYFSQTSPVIEKSWAHLNKQIVKPCNQHKATEDILETLLKSKLQEWILERLAEGCRVTPLDDKGQGVIHLCAMLNYVWSVRLFSLSGLSLDFRDSSGWTALHWAAFYGREKMVATLLSAGANPSLVTDPTHDSPGGATAADLAASQNFEGLAAFLAEKGLISHFEAMSINNNLDPNPNHPNPKKLENPNFSNLSEQELCLKDSLAAYRNAAEAADKIQAAFRERALKSQTKQARMENSEMDAGLIVAALKIQNAFRNYERRKAMKAAARIQSHFRTWQLRREFLQLRKHAIRIQAVFRGHQVRRHYKKIIWSVGIVEKAILRWRLKKRGLRGIHAADVAANDSLKVDSESENPSTGEDGPTGEDNATGEEDFFRISRVQAEDRYKRSVVRVQALFRSYKAQQEYRRMKMTHEQASLEYGESDTDN